MKLTALIVILNNLIIFVKVCGKMKKQRVVKIAANP